MIARMSTDYKELHERNYSIYGSDEEKEEALKELHERSYLILDKEDYELLFEEYCSEFDRLAKTFSFVSTSLNGSRKSLFVSRTRIKKDSSDTCSDMDNS